MAQATLKGVITERVVIEEHAGIELCLTMDEAAVLLRIVGHIGGMGQGRRETNAIYDALVGKVRGDYEMTFGREWWLE